MTLYAIMYVYKGKIVTEIFQSKEQQISLKLIYEIQRYIPVKSRIYHISLIEE